MEISPSIHVHIDRVILDGLPFTTANAEHIRAALETELGRILGENVITQSSQSAAVDRLAPFHLSLSPTTTPNSFGRAVAGTLGTSLSAAFAPTHPVSSP